MGKAKRLIIAIDGPAGSGKSTVSKMIAKSLGLLYIDTGAMYRALTLKAMKMSLRLEDEDALVKLACSTSIDLRENGGSLHIFLDGEDVSGAIRTVEVTNNIKYIARIPGVRREMVKLQRSIGKKHGAVLEGRDIGTVVFPDADYKFYLDADVEERANRRYKELAASGNNISMDALKEDVIARDLSDMERAVGPLKRAEDAIFIDTTRLSIEGVAEEALSHIR